MLDIDEEKLPPPKPQNKASINIVSYEVAGFCTAWPIPIAGISKVAVLSTVQFLPPKIGTTNEYIMRSVAPVRPGTAASVNNCCLLKLNPILFRLTAPADHIIHGENASNRQGMEIHRLRAAIFFPDNPRSVHLQDSIAQAHTC